MSTIRGLPVCMRSDFIMPVGFKFLIQYSFFLKGPYFLVKIHVKI